MTSFQSFEAVSWSFVSHDMAVLFGGGSQSLALANPIAGDLSDMRPSLLPGLMGAVGRNLARGNADVGVFEVGQIFRGDGEGDQRVAVAAVRSGTAKSGGGGRHWSGQSGTVDLFDAKADVMAMLEALGVQTGGLRISAGGSTVFHPGRSASLGFGPKTTFGWFGEIHPRVLATMDIEGPMVGFEIVLDDIPPPKLKATKAKQRLDLSDLMPLRRDFAFIVDRAVEAGSIVKAAQGADRNLISRVTVFDIYEGQGVPPDKKSVAIAATIQPRDTTLTEAEIEVVMAKIITDVTKKTAAILRG